MSLFNRRGQGVHSSTIAGVIAGSLMLAAFTGCETHPTPAEMRPDISSLQPGDKGLQSKDLVQMSDQMAGSILQAPEIVQNPNKITVVTTGIDNKTSQPTTDLTIFVKRLEGLLAQSAHDRIAFVERRTVTQGLQQADGGNSDVFEEGSRTGAPKSTRIVAQYALKGEFYDLPRGQTTYYLCQFQLTSIATGQIVWQGQYEVRSLN